MNEIIREYERTRDYVATCRNELASSIHRANDAQRRLEDLLATTGPLRDLERVYFLNAGEIETLVVRDAYHAYAATEAPEAA